MNRLNEAHRSDLRKSGITDESIERCGLRSFSATETQEHLGFSAGPGLAFLYPNTRGPEGRDLTRIKLDDPLGSMKYASPKKEVYSAGNRLYFCPLLDRKAITDSSVELLFTEGEKKAILACQLGIQTIGLSGVHNWRGRDSKDNRVVIPDLDRIDFRGRSVGIVFDSDAEHNDSVKGAELGLCRELERRGAKPFIVRLPTPKRHEEPHWGGKFGLDDFVMARGAHELRQLIAWNRNPLPLGCRSVSVLEGFADQERPFLIEGLWKVGDCGFVAGSPKTKKSLFVLDLGIAVAAGQSFLNRKVTAGPVIVADEETNRIEFRSRVRSFLSGRGLSFSDARNLHFVDKGSLKLDEPASIDELRRLCRLIRPRAIILDPFVRMHGKDENSTQDVSPMLGRLRRLSDEFEVSIIIVHHFNKSGVGDVSARMRGSSDLHGWFDGAAFTKNTGQDIEVSFEYRYGLPADNQRIRLEDDGENGLSWKVVSDDDGPVLVPIDQRILNVLRDGPSTTTELSKELGISGAILKAAIDELVRDERVVRLRGTSTGGRPPSYLSLPGDDGDLLSDNFFSPKEKKKVRKSDDLPDIGPVGPDGVAGSDDSGDATDPGVSDSASALTGDGSVRNGPDGEPNTGHDDGTVCEPLPGLNADTQAD